MCMSSFIPSDPFALLSSVNPVVDVRPPETVSSISSTLFFFHVFVLFSHSFGQFLCLGSLFLYPIVQYFVKCLVVISEILLLLEI